MAPLGEAEKATLRAALKEKRGARTLFREPTLDRLQCVLRVMDLMRVSVCVYVRSFPPSDHRV